MKNNENETNSNETKICTKCRTPKTLDQFVKDISRIDGFGQYCKECKKIINENWKKTNSNKFNESRKRSYIKNRSDILKYVNEYNIKHKDKRKEYNKNNRERDKEYLLKYNTKNKDIISPKRKKYNKQNRENINKYQNHKYNTDLNYRLGSLFRCRIYIALKDDISKPKKKTKSLILLGCTIEEFKLHLEKQFKPEMTWSNWGEIWEIDHIKPCSKFDLNKEEEQLECFSYKNQQPIFKTTEIAESFGYKNYIGNRNKLNKYND